MGRELKLIGVLLALTLQAWAQVEIPTTGIWINSPNPLLQEFPINSSTVVVFEVCKISMTDKKDIPDCLKVYSFGKRV